MTASSAIWNGWACTGTGSSGSRTVWTVMPRRREGLRQSGRLYEVFETPTELDLEAQEAAQHGQAAGL